MFIGWFYLPRLSEVRATKWDEPCYVSVEVDNRRCRVVEALREVGVAEFELMDVRSYRGGATRHLVKLSPEDSRRAAGSSLLKSSGENLRFKGRFLVWVESEGCRVCRTLLSYGSFLVSARRIGGSRFVYSFVAPNPGSVKDILSSLELAGFHPEVVRLERFRARRRILTEKQERALWAALRMGFFDYPRRIGVGELSEKFGVKPSTLSEVMRRGLRRLLEEYFKRTDSIFR